MSRRGLELEYREQAALLRPHLVAPAQEHLQEPDHFQLWSPPDREDIMEQVLDWVFRVLIAERAHLQPLQMSPQDACPAEWKDVCQREVPEMLLQNRPQRGSSMPAMHNLLYLQSQTLRQIRERQTPFSTPVMRQEEQKVRRLFEKRLIRL
jgi:hypothetical protein